MTSVLSFVLALLMTTVLIPVCRRYASHIGLIDEPGEMRRVHLEAIPRSGGIAIVLGALIATAVWLPTYQHYLPFIGCICVIAFFGLLDDLTELPSSIKFVGQLIAAFWFIYAYGGVTQLPFSPLDSASTALCLFLSFLFLLGITNAVNLSDGLDGLAAGNSLLSLGLLAVFAAQLGEVGYLILALTTTGGLLGFLRFNTHPASIFMGDTGSQFIGFTAAALTILLMQNESLPVSPMLPVLIFGLPILDTLSVMGVRLVRGRPIFQADRSHLHHQFLKMGFQHYQVVAILYSLQAVVVGFAYALRYESDALILAAYLAFCGVVLSLILWARLSNWQTHGSKRGLEGRERRNLWLRKLEWYHLHTAKVLAAALGIFFVAGAWFMKPLPDAISDFALIAAALMLATQLLRRNHEQAITRLAGFTVTAFLVYGFLADTGTNSTQGIAVDLDLIAVVAALGLAIRVTRHERFALDNQDYLVLLVVVLAPLVLLEQFDGEMITRSVLRLAILVYACEYVASKGRHTRPVMNAAGILGLLIMGLK
jgi:UDP-GlcNAc:undecaprenyl-phosphate GlcNAc-1-phosphate transferase